MEINEKKRKTSGGNGHAEPQSAGHPDGLKQGHRFSEFGLIHHIRTLFADIPSGNMMGIGDDCAVIPVNDTESMVITTDMLVENIHFLRDKTPPVDLGYKSLAVNLSDVAAMGAVPVGSFLSVGLPSGLPDEWIVEFLHGYHELSAKYEMPLLGGDTTSSDGKITVSVTAIGRAQPQKLKYRSSAKQHDKILVSGKLGSSSQGFIELNKMDIFDQQTDFIREHNRPEPQVPEGVWLGQQSAVHAMMDLSDGLASDLLHVLRASGVRAEIDLDTIPTDVGVKAALTGGEDYKLLFTADPEQTPALCQQYLKTFGEPLYIIGEITTGPPRIDWLKSGKIQDLKVEGFTHF